MCNPNCVKTRVIHFLHLPSHRGCLHTPYLPLHTLMCVQSEEHHTQGNVTSSPTLRAIFYMIQLRTGHLSYSVAESIGRINWPQSFQLHGECLLYAADKDLQVHNIQACSQCMVNSAMQLTFIVQCGSISLYTSHFVMLCLYIHCQDHLEGYSLHG